MCRAVAPANAAVPAIGDSRRVSTGLTSGMTDSSSGERSTDGNWLGRPWFWIGIVAGLVIWIATMARYPRYTDGAGESAGNPALFPLLALAALILGYLEPLRPRVVAASLLAAPLLLAPWTTPRGDGDGLWGLMLPILVG